MPRLVRISLAAAALLLSAVQTPVMARAASNVGHGMTCYNYPVVAPDGSVTYQRVCFKRP